MAPWQRPEVSILVDSYGSRWRSFFALPDRFSSRCLDLRVKHESRDFTWQLLFSITADVNRRCLSVIADDLMSLQNSFFSNKEAWTNTICIVLNGLLLKFEFKIVTCMSVFKSLEIVLQLIEKQWFLWK